MKASVAFGVVFVCLVCEAYGLSKGEVGQDESKPAVPAQSAPCAPAAFLTFESGKLAGVDWVERKGNQVHSRSVLTQSRVIDATIELRPDQTAIHSSVVLSAPGDEPMKPMVRDLGEGAIYWSDMIASSVEEAVLRARVLGQPSSKVTASNLYHETRGEVLVERVDATDWVVTYNSKRYEVLSDERGCMMAATLPDHGITIERRANFAADRYPLWPPNAAPPQ